MSEVHTLRPQVNSVSSKTLRTALEIFDLAKRVEGCRKSTLEANKYFLHPFLVFLGDVPVSGITIHDIRAYLDTQERRCKSRVTFHHLVARLMTFFHFLQRERFISENPMELIRKPKIPKQFPHVLSEGQVQKLLKAPNPKTWEGCRNIAMLLCFLDTGLRLGELLRLNLQDISMSTRSIIIHEGKGEKSRVLFMGKTLAQALHRWLEIRGYHEAEEAFFITREGDRLKKRNLESIVSRLAGKAGITGVRCSPHTLRHTFATLFVKNGADPFSLQAILGHSNIQTVMIYVHMAGVHLREACMKASPVDRLGE